MKFLHEALTQNVEISTFCIVTEDTFLTLQFENSAYLELLHHWHLKNSFSFWGSFFFNLICRLSPYLSQIWCETKMHHHQCFTSGSMFKHSRRYCRFKLERSRKLQNALGPDKGSIWKIMILLFLRYFLCCFCTKHILWVLIIYTYNPLIILRQF